MAHSLSARKRVRQNEKRRLRNRAARSALKTSLRRCLEAFADGATDAAERTFKQACKLLDRDANRGVIHRNEAARRKSRLARRLNALRQKSGAAPSA